MNDDDVSFDRVKLYSFNTSTTITCPYMKGFLAIGGSDVLGNPAGVSVTCLDATGITFTMTLDKIISTDPNNNLNGSGLTAGIANLIDNSITFNPSTTSLICFYPFVITEATATYVDDPSGPCQIIALF